LAESDRWSRPGPHPARLCLGMAERSGCGL